MTADTLTVSWFPTAMPTGKPALGQMETMTWHHFAGVFCPRREGAKDGPCVVPATFTLEQDGRHVRRKRENLVLRTAIAMDIETHKSNGEVPPSFADAAERVRQTGWAAVLCTSHSHQADAPRFRIVIPIAEPIGPDLPAPEVIADKLGLRGVLDESKIGASSVFYLPSCEPDQLDHHDTLVIEGAPIDSAWLRATSGALLAAREAEAARQAEEAHKAAAARREAKLAAGFNPDDSLIEKLRGKFDLEDVLRGHGYDKAGTKYRHPNSSSGAYGANIKVLGGIERIFSHNGTDPLHASNLPMWCEGVTAVDVVDVVCILEFGGDRQKALRTLATRFGLTKAEERKAVAALIFGLIRDRASQEAIEAAARAEGARLGLTWQEVCRTAAWVSDQAINSRRAA